MKVKDIIFVKVNEYSVEESLREKLSKIVTENIENTEHPPELIIEAVSDLMDDGVMIVTAMEDDIIHYYTFGECMSYSLVAMDYPGSDWFKRSPYPEFIVKNQDGLMIYPISIIESPEEFIEETMKMLMSITEDCFKITVH